MRVIDRCVPIARLAVPVFAVTLMLAACGGDDDSPATSVPAATATSAPATVAAATRAGSPAASPAAIASPAAAVAASSDGPVLPVESNPIADTSTAQSLKIDSVLVENNEDPATGKDAPDHLEITLSNTGPEPLTGFEIFYTFSDPTASISESYYAALPDTFSIPADGTRTVHFDETGQPDHFPVNKFSLYATSTNELDVTVMVSAVGAAPQTATVKKDAGGAELPD